MPSLFRVTAEDPAATDWSGLEGEDSTLLPYVGAGWT